MLSMRRRLLDMAVFIARHIVDHWWSTESASTHLRTAVDTGRPRIGMKSDAENQLCVPAVEINGPSYRLKDRDLGRVPAAATEEP
jgi:acyl-coenzyme A synthetase/AMP-(fatty) acid ligase